MSKWEGIQVERVCTNRVFERRYSKTEQTRASTLPLTPRTRTHAIIYEPIQSGVAVAPPVLAVFTYVGWLACAALVPPAGCGGRLMDPNRGFPAPGRRPGRVGARCGRHKKCRFG